MSTAPEAVNEIYINPERPTPKRKPLKAWRHFWILRNDKEDTDQVFRIIEALDGKRLRTEFARFLKSENGAALFAKKRNLPEMLDDHETLKKLPANTVARAYVDFMERENLTAQGLVDESVKRPGYRDYGDDLQWYGERQRDVHDLHHVLTGYGRDPLGEATLLGYNRAQGSGLGVGFIAFMGTYEMQRVFKGKADIWAVRKEGQRNGKAAKRIDEQDIEQLLRMDLAEARKMLNIPKPVVYKETLAQLRALEDFQEWGVPEAAEAA